MFRPFNGQFFKAKQRDRFRFHFAQVLRCSFRVRKISFAGVIWNDVGSFVKQCLVQKLGHRIDRNLSRF